MPKGQKKQTAVSKPAEVKADASNGAELVKNNVFSYWAEALVLNILAVLPLYLNKYKYIELTKHKTQYLWVTTLIFFAVFAIGWLTFAGLVKGPGFRKRLANMKTPDWAVALYLVFIYASAVFSPLESGFSGKNDTWYFMNGAVERHDGIITLTVYVALYFAVSRLFAPKERDWVIFAVSASLVSLIGYLQFIGFDIFELYPYGYSSETIGVYPYNYHDIIFKTTLGNVDIISPFVCIGIGFFLTLYMKNNTKHRFLYLAATALTFAMMIMSGADGGKFGVVIMAVFLLAFNITDKTALSRMFFALSLSSLLTVPRSASLAAREYYSITKEEHIFNWSGMYKDMWFLAAIVCLLLALGIKYIPVWIKGRQGLAAAIAMAVFIVTGLAGVEVIGAKIEDKENIIYQAREVMHLNLEDEFGSFRGFIWNYAVKVVPDNLWLGTGPDTFEYAFAEYQPLAIVTTNTRFDKAHNDYLQILVCNGLLALLAFLVFVIALAVKAISKVWGDIALMACFMACAAFLVQALFGISTPMVTPLFFVLAGIVRRTAYVRAD